MVDCPVSEVGEHEGAEVRIRGWLYHRRSGGKLQFLLVRDGTGLIQAVVSLRDAGEEVFGRAQEVTQESSLSVTGTVRADARAPGSYEILVKDLEVYQRTEDYPI